jgi:ribosomal protein L44E
MVGVLDATTPKQLLRCDECGRADRGERGWRAHLTREPREVALFCPACAAREFGEVGADPGRRS